MPRSAVITYDGLPLSRGGAHTLRTRGPKEAWNSIVHFLDRCTDYNAPKSMIVEVFEGYAIPESFSTAMKKRFQSDFGNPGIRIVGDHRGSQYSVPTGKLDEVLEYIDAAQPYPHSLFTTPFGPVTINISAQYKWVAQEGSRMLPFQDLTDYLNFEVGHQLFLGVSTLYAILSIKSSVSVFFSLPFEDDTPEFRFYVQFLQSHLPFRLSERTWKRWHINRNHTGYVARKFSFAFT